MLRSFWSNITVTCACQCVEPAIGIRFLFFLVCAVPLSHITTFLD